MVINVEDKDAIEWLKTDPGRSWAQNHGFPDPLVIKPERECRMDDPRPIIDLVGIHDGATITEKPFVIAGVIDATANFKQFKLHWAPDRSDEWHALTPDWITVPISSASEIVVWDLEGVDVPVITLRVTLHSTINTGGAEEVGAYDHGSDRDTDANSDTNYAAGTNGNAISTDPAARANATDLRGALKKC